MVRPGLTGLAQIKGRNSVNWDERLNYDVIYIQKITFIKDFKIILLTLGKVLRKSDITTVGDVPFQNLDIERGSINHEKT